MRTRRVFEQLGCVVEEAEPDFAGVDDAFPTLRYASNYTQYAALLDSGRDWVKDTIKLRGRAGRGACDGADVARALTRQTRMYQDSRRSSSATTTSCCR